MYPYHEVDADEQPAETAQQLAVLIAVLAELRAQPLWLGQVPANTNTPAAE